jgi:hypothetical protein
MSPMAVTPPASVDTQTLAATVTPQEIFFDTAAASKKDASDINSHVKEGLISKPVAEALVENIQSEITVESPSNAKKVNLVKGKRNSQSMDLLTVLLLLKESQR